MRVRVRVRVRVNPNRILELADLRCGGGELGRGLGSRLGPRPGLGEG